jgi:hypothetical protein
LPLVTSRGLEITGPPPTGTAAGAYDAFVGDGISLRRVVTAPFPSIVPAVPTPQPPAIDQVAGQLEEYDLAGSLAR